MEKSKLAPWWGTKEKKEENGRGGGGGESKVWDLKTYSSSVMQYDLFNGGVSDRFRMS